MNELPEPKTDANLRFAAVFGRVMLLKIHVKKLIFVDNLIKKKEAVSSCETASFY